MCHLFCNIVKLFNLVVACCAKTDCMKLRMSYAIRGIYGLSATTFLHLQRPDLLHNRQGHPKGIIGKKTWKQQQSMLNAFWSHFKHFGRLLGKSYLFHTPSKTDGRVPSQQGALTPCNLTHWEASQLTFVQPLLTSKIFSSEWMRLSRIWRIKQIEEGVIHRGRRPKWITPFEICLILHIIRKPNSLIALLFIQNNS